MGLTGYTQAHWKWSMTNRGYLKQEQWKTEAIYNYGHFYLVQNGEEIPSAYSVGIGDSNNGCGEHV